MAARATARQTAVRHQTSTPPSVQPDPAADLGYSMGHAPVRPPERIPVNIGYRNREFNDYVREQGRAYLRAMNRRTQGRWDRTMAQAIREAYAHARWIKPQDLDEVEMEPLAFSILAEGYRLRKLSPPRTSALIRAAPRSRRWSIAWALDNRVGSNVAINR